MTARGGDHQVVDPSSGIFFWDGLADGEIQLRRSLVFSGQPMARTTSWFWKRLVSSPRWPRSFECGLEFDQFFSDGGELIVRQIVKLRRVRLVEAEDLSSEVDGGKIIPDGDFAFVFRIPKNRPRIRGLRKYSGVIEERIRSHMKGTP